MLKLADLIRLFIVFIGLSLFSVGIASATPPVDYLEVDGPQSGLDLSEHISYYLDPEWDKNLDDMVGALADKFKPIETTKPDFGYIDSKVWLRLKLKNITQDNDDWRLYVRENFLQYYDVYVVREDGTVNHIESHTPSTVFSERTIDYPELVSPITFAPDERITLFISYWSGGSSNAALSFETLDSFSTIALRRTSKYYISYGMMAILLVASFLALLIFRLEVLLSYIGCVGVTLLYLVHIDGVAFQFIWPHFPRFNSYFSIIIGAFFVAVTYNFARVFLQTKIYHPRIDKLLFFLNFTSLFIICIGAVVDPQTTKKAIILMIFIAILSGTITGILASFKRFKQVRFYLFAWVCGVLTAGLMNLRHIFGIDIGPVSYTHLTLPTKA